MNKVVIITDSTCDLEPAVLKERNIEVVPLIVRFNDEVFLDGVEINQKELYKKVEELNILPSTSSQSSEYLKEVFKKWVDKGFDVVYIGIGSTLSSGYNSAYIASQEFDDGRVLLADSKNLSSATGLMVLKAADMRDEGKSSYEIKDFVDKNALKLVGQFAVETLDYLYKGGRCSGVKMLLGKLFHIHPLLRVVNGKLIVFRKIRGPIQRALKEQIDSLREDMPYVDDKYFLITSAGADKNVIDYAYNELSKVVDKNHIMISSAGCVISSHCGYGTIGVLYLKK